MFSFHWTPNPYQELNRIGRDKIKLHNIKMDNSMFDALINFNTTVLAGASIFAVFEYLRRRLKGVRRARLDMLEDISSSLDYAKAAKVASDTLIKTYEDDNSDPDSLKSVPFYSFVNSPRLTNILEKNSDLLSEGEIKNTVLYHEQILTFECMVADTKTELFSKISKEKRVNFYRNMELTLDEVIKCGDEAKKSLSKNITNLI